MADRDAVADLFARYAWANDTCDVGLVEKLFLENPIFSLSVAGAAAVGPIETRTELLTFFGGAFEAQTDERRHVTTNFRYAEETEDSARVFAYLLLIATDAGVPSIRCTGVYTAQVVRCDDGAWAFAELEVALDSAF